VNSAPHRSGFAALVGRPNVGKSTLLNALVGQKLSIVTPRPQTTRHRILGIYTSAAEQIAFLDTPGLHKEASRALNKAMNRTAAAALEEADVVVLVLEALKWTAEDELVLARLARSPRSTKSTACTRASDCCPISKTSASAIPSSPSCRSRR
jgi:GTPase